LGTLIFVGIMFTAVIPMLLAMRQADTFYEKEKFELGRLDEERVRENLIFYVIPLTEPLRLSFIIENMGELLIKIERIWLNDEYGEVDYLIPPISNRNFEYLIDPEPSAPVSYSIMVVTDKGKIFSPYSGTPTYDPLEGWEMDSFTIFIMMTDPLSQLHILVNNTYGEGPLEPPVTYFDDNVENNQAGYSISVPLPGEYYVEVTRWHDTPSEVTLCTGLVNLGLTSPTVLIIV